MDPELLVADYLRDLEAAASGLSPDQRVELVRDVRDHIELALAEAGRADEATVRNVLERLGSPEGTVAEAVEPAPSSRGTAEPSEPAVRSRPLSVETKALRLLTIGAVALPFVGPLLGLWFVSASTRWTLAQKRTAAIVVIALLAMPSVVLLPPIASGELTWVITSGGFLLPFVPLAGIVAAAYLVGSTSLVVTVSRRG